jgi:hypothetical protein
VYIYIWIYDTTMKSTRQAREKQQPEESTQKKPTARECVACVSWITADQRKSEFFVFSNSFIFL